MVKAHNTVNRKGTAMNSDAGCGESHLKRCGFWLQRETNGRQLSLQPRKWQQSSNTSRPQESWCTLVRLLSTGEWLCLSLEAYAGLVMTRRVSFAVISQSVGQCSAAFVTDETVELHCGMFVEPGPQVSPGEHLPGIEPCDAPMQVRCVFLG